AALPHTPQLNRVQHEQVLAITARAGDFSPFQHLDPEAVATTIAHLLTLETPDQRARYLDQLQPTVPYQETNFYLRWNAASGRYCNARERIRAARAAEEREGPLDTDDLGMAELFERMSSTPSDASPPPASPGVGSAESPEQSPQPSTSRPTG